MSVKSNCPICRDHIDIYQRMYESGEAHSIFFMECKNCGNFYISGQAENVLYKMTLTDAKIQELRENIKKGYYQNLDNCIVEDDIVFE